MAKASDNTFPKVIISEGSTPASPSAGSQKLFIDSSDHKLKRVNSSGTVTQVEPSGGAGGIIAYNSYAPSSLATYTVTATSPTDVDATNMLVTFTAPASGKVLVRLSALCACNGAAAGRWSLRAASSDVAGSLYQALQSTTTDTRSVSIPITGLTPGNSYTYKWAASRNGGTNTVIYAGNDSTAAGAAVMEVHALP